MRTYNDIINEYLEWYAYKNGDNSFLPSHYFVGSDEEISVKKAAVWKNLIERCYDTTYGIFWFTKFILGDLTYAGYPEPIRFNSLWLKWSLLSNSGDHIAIVSARQHGKSSFWSMLLPLYRTTLYDNYNVLIESASEDQAIALLSLIINIIERNEFLSSKKSSSGKWSSTEITFNGGKIVGKGVGSEVRGSTFDMICADDILRSDNKLSDADIKRFIDEELEPMLLVRRGQLIVVGTRKSDSDIFSTIYKRSEEGRGWKIYTFPAILNHDTKQLLCPDRFTWEQLMYKKRVIGQRSFDKEFLCKTYSSGSQLFPQKYINRAIELGNDYVVYSKKDDTEMNTWLYRIGVDCARAGTASGDYTVVTVIAHNQTTQEKRLVWLWRAKGLKISTQVENIAEISQKFDHPPILVERNNIGQEFIDLMVDNYNLHVEQFTTGARGQRKDDLIRMLITAFENEKMIIPNGDVESKEMMEPLTNELGRFVLEITRAGNERMHGSGSSHDDCVMSLALANRCSMMYSGTPFAAAVEKSSRANTPLERYATTNNEWEVLNFDGAW